MNLQLKSHILYQKEFLQEAARTFMQQGGVRWTAHNSPPPYDVRGPGRDEQEMIPELLKVTDTVTGEYAQIPVTVTADAFLSIEPSLLMMPLGTQFPISVKGGSGTITYDIPEGVASLKDGIVTAKAPGKMTVKVTDPAVACMGPDGSEKLQASLEIVVAKAHEIPVMNNSRSRDVAGRQVSFDGGARDHFDRIS